MEKNQMEEVDELQRKLNDWQAQYYILKDMYRNQEIEKVDALKAKDNYEDSVMIKDLDIQNLKETLSKV